MQRVRWLLAGGLAAGCGSPCEDVLVLNSDPVTGGVVYRNRCDGCHGPAGEGGTGPALTQIIPNADECGVTNQVLLGGSDMPAFEDTLSLQEIADVVSYVMLEFR